MASLLRLHVDLPLIFGTELALPADGARHVQVRRLQPGDTLRLFDGRGGETEAQVLRMSRQGVDVRVGQAVPTVPDLKTSVTLALGVPANDRMDLLVEKATELGVSCIQPLITERSVVRLEGERAQRRVAHWLGIARAAAEQCGRASVPVVLDWTTLPAWLASEAGARPPPTRWILSPSAGAAQALRAQAPPAQGRLLVLSGPEGGLSEREEQLAQVHGFQAVSLGPRVLRADTAPLASLAWISLLS
jgi:16S rRNA (uracil1498-N3)-methyltransferase